MDTLFREFTVAHLTSVHAPFDGRIFHKECRSLADAGFKVFLVAPNEKDAIVDGVYIRGVRQAKTRLGRMIRTTWAVYRKAVEIKADLFHLHDPELIPMGLLLKLSGARVIFDAHEDLPRDVMNKEWIPKGIRRIVAKCSELGENLAVQFFDAVVGATPQISQCFPPNKSITVRNYPILEEWLPAEPKPHVSRPEAIAYVGGITRVRGIMEMIKAISHLDRFPNARLVLAGKFVPAGLEALARQSRGWARAEYRGWLSREDVSELLNQARCGLVLLHNVPGFVESLPTKLFEYMSAGLPVIGANLPQIRRIVDEGECGLIVDPLDEHAVAEAIAWILKHPEESEEMGRRGQELARTKYNWDTEARRLVSLYKRLLSGKPAENQPLG